MCHFYIVPKFISNHKIINVSDFYENHVWSAAITFFVQFPFYYKYAIDFALDEYFAF